jgi:hypothetical protein
VSYLTHEGRHFADYQLFPALEQIDLEYRAKLTELVYAEESLLSVLGHFVSAGSLNERAPHAYANECVVRNLSGEIFGEERVAERARWTQVPTDRVHEVARTLLLAHDAALNAAGARTTTGVLLGARAKPGPIASPD